MDKRMDRRSRLRRVVRRGAVGLALLVVLLGGVENGRAQSSPRVEARVSVDSVKIGERFTLTLVAERAADADVVFPSPEAGAPVFGDLSVIRRGEVQTRTTAEGRRVDSLAYTVAAFAVDSARVPILPVRLVTGGDTTVAGSAPRLVPMVSVVGPEAESLRTPVTLASFPRTFWRWGMLVLAVLVVVVGGAYVWWRRRRDGSGQDVSDRQTRSPHKVVVAQLRQLSRRNPNDRESCKAFYVELTEAVRVYLAERLDVRALECTTPELIGVLRTQRDVPESAVSRLQTVLERADLVKFADTRPAPEESQALVTETRGVLDVIEAAQRRAETRTADEETRAVA